jgi:hypothetical protein
MAYVNVHGVKQQIKRVIIHQKKQIIYDLDLSDTLDTDKYLSDTLDTDNIHCSWIYYTAVFVKHWLYEIENVELKLSKFKSYFVFLFFVKLQLWVLWSVT